MMQICLESGPYTYNAYLISISMLGPLSEGPGAVHKGGMLFISGSMTKNWKK